MTLQDDLLKSICSSNFFLRNHTSKLVSGILHSYRINNITEIVLYIYTRNKYCLETDSVWVLLSIFFIVLCVHNVALLVTILLRKHKKKIIREYYHVLVVLFLFTDPCTWARFAKPYCKYRSTQTVVKHNM